MAGPKQKTSSSGGGDDDESFPAAQLGILAICRLAEPIAFTSILAYTFVMVKNFDGIDENDASFYAGLLVSAFAVAEACTAMTWGSISDRYGRKPIILVGLAGTALSSLVFGFATNFWVALAARVIGGLLNGNVAVMQTMVAEMCKKPEWEPRAYAMPPFMWSLGTIVGAAMGGYLAEPARYYPSVFSPDGLFGKYPYLLPNVVSVAFILVAILQGWAFLKETNPRFENQTRSDSTSRSNAGPASERTPLRGPIARRGSAVDILSTGKRRPSFISGSMPTMNEPSFDLRKGSVTTVHDIKPVVIEVEAVTEDDEDSEIQPPMKAFTKSVILWTIALIVMCYHQMAFASLLPVYLLDTPQKPPKTFDPVGGLGYTVHDIGTFMSVNGVIALVIQLTIFPFFVARVGVWRSLAVLLPLAPIPYLAAPFLSTLSRSAMPAGVYTVLTLQNFLLIIIYPCLLIMLKKVTPSTLVLGKVNGLAMSACSGSRTISPPLVGIIYGHAGSAAACWSIAAVAVIGALQLCWLARPKDDAGVVIENVLSRANTATATTAVPPLAGSSERD